MNIQELRIQRDILNAKIERLERGRPTLAKSNPEMTEKLTEACFNYIGAVENGSEKLSVYENEVFEAAVEAVFGKDVWDWINEVM